jgi:hypothetical protein
MSNWLPCLLDDESVPLERQLAAIEREIRIRLRVYPVRISTHRMTPRHAAEELAAMRAVERTLRALIAERAGS